MLPCAEPPRCQARGRQHPGANSEGHRATAAARPAGRRRRPALPGREPPKKFLASLAARTRIRTRPHIHRRGRPPRPPCLVIEKRTHPTELPTPGERSAGRAQHASHRILSQRRAPAPPRGAELTRGKRFCGEPGGGEPHATSPRNDPTHPTHATTPPYSILSRRSSEPASKWQKYFSRLRTPGLPDSRTPGLPDTPALPALPHSRTPALPHSRTPALPHSRTPALPPRGVPESRPSPGLPPRSRPSPGLPLQSRPSPGLPRAAPVVKVEMEPASKWQKYFSRLRTPGLPDSRTPGLRTPGLPHSRTPGLPHSRTPALPHSRTPGLPHSRTPGLPDSRTPGLPHSRTPGLPHSRTPGLPHSRTPALPHSRTPGLPHSRTPGLPHSRRAESRSPAPVPDSRFSPARVPDSRPTPGLPPESRTPEACPCGES